MPDTSHPRHPRAPSNAAPPPWWSFINRKWLLLAAAVAILLIAIWAISRRDGVSPAPTPPANARSTGGLATDAASDSVVTLDSAAMRLAGVELETVAARGQSELVANGTITYDANRVSVIASRADGRLVSVRADLGQAVNAGTVLAILESPEVGGVRGDLERAQANADIARKNYDREKRLYEEQISPQKELLDAEATLRTAEADYNSALARLRALGATGGQGGRFGLATSISGTVVERNASPGQTVGPSTNLFTVADLRHVWITVDVYERDLARVKQGARATIVPTALPGQTFTGHVTYAGGIVDTASRTFKVRVEVENEARRLRPGMFAQARIEAPAIAAAATGDAAVVLSVPVLAVQEVGGKSVVFVAAGAPGRFVARPITLGAREGDGTVAVTAGLRPGERIAVAGAFQLKAELTKASLGESE